MWILNTIQDHLRVFVFYEWRRGTGAAANVRNINCALEEVTLLSSKDHFVQRRKLGLRRQTSVGTPYTVDDSAILAEVKLDPEVSTRTGVKLQ